MFKAIKRYWRELRYSNRGVSWRSIHLELKLILFDDDPHFSFNFMGFYIPLPFLNRWAWEPYEMLEAWGFSYHDRTMYLQWGKWGRFIDMPWARKHIKTEIQQLDGEWVSDKCEHYNYNPAIHRHYHYTYTLKNGEKQHRIATVHIERMEHRWKWFAWLSTRYNPTALIRKSIHVSFNDEVGERTGSWKGGVIGCGYEMKSNETMEECLRRMEKERIFD